MSNEHGGAAQPQGSPDDAPDPQFMKEFAEVLESWAEATTAGKAEEAHDVAMRALAMCAEEQLRNPDPSVMLQGEADDLESRGDWPEAEMVRRKVLAMAEAAGNFGKMMKAQMDLCRLLRATGRGEEAWPLAGAATDSARRTGIRLLVVRASLNEASCALEKGDSAKALAAAEEAVQAVEPGKLHDKVRGRALTARANCLLAHGDPAGAEADLAAGWELLQANSGSSLMPGTIWTLGHWWEVKSRLEERRGNLFCAREAMTFAIEHRRQSESPHGLLAVARDLEKLGEFSRTAGDRAAEEQSLNEANSIREGLHLAAGG